MMSKFHVSGSPGQRGAIASMLPYLPDRAGLEKKTARPGALFSQTTNDDSIWAGSRFLSRQDTEFVNFSFTNPDIWSHRAMLSGEIGVSYFPSLWRKRHDLPDRIGDVPIRLRQGGQLSLDAESQFALK